MESWTLNCTSAFWKKPYCHQHDSSILELIIYLCKTTTPNIHPDEHVHFFVENGIEWWKTPPESPDLNPIENLWHELKEYIRRAVKPKTKADLIAGIKEFWGTADTQKCQKYIGHLRKVIPKVIEVEGAASGY